MLVKLFTQELKIYFFLSNNCVDNKVGEGKGYVIWYVWSISIFEGSTYHIRLTVPAESVELLSFDTKVVV